MKFSLSRLIIVEVKDILFAFEKKTYLDFYFTALCMATYMFVNMQWTGTVSESYKIIQWGDNNGAMYTLGPDESLNGNYLFPAGFRSICSIFHYFTVQYFVQ